jgi:hypothetical protein
MNIGYKSINGSPEVKPCGTAGSMGEGEKSSLKEQQNF